MKKDNIWTYFVLSFLLSFFGCYHLCYHLMLSFITVSKCYHFYVIIFPCTYFVLSFMLSFDVIIYCYLSPPFFFFLKTWHTRKWRKFLRIYKKSLSAKYCIKKTIWWNILMACDFGRCWLVFKFTTKKQNLSATCETKNMLMTWDFGRCSQEIFVFAEIFVFFKNFPKMIVFTKVPPKYV